MPQAIIYDKDRALREGISSAGDAFGQALAKRGEDLRSQQLKEAELTRQTDYSGIVSTELASLPQNPSKMDVIQAYGRVLEKIPLNETKNFTALVEPILKDALSREGTKSFMDDLFGDGQGAPGTPVSGGEVIEEAALARSSPVEMGQPTQLQPTGAPQAPQQPVPPQAGGGRDINLESLTDSQIAKLVTSGNKSLEELGKAAISAKTSKRKEFVEDRKYHAEGAKEAEKKAAGLRESLPMQEFAQNMATDAVQSGEVGAFSLANIGARFGIPELQTAKGAQLITAGKEFLLGNMARVSARAQNQWFEERLASMFPKVGQSIEANETIDAALRGEQAMRRAWLTEYDKLYDQDVKEHGFPLRDLDKRVSANVEPEYKTIFDKSSFEMRKVYEREKGSQWLYENRNKKVPQGTFLTPNMMEIFSIEFKNEDGTADVTKILEQAKKRGYTIPKRKG